MPAVSRVRVRVRVQEAIVGLLMTKYRVSVSEGSGKFGSVRFGRRDSKT